MLKELKKDIDTALKHFLQEHDKSLHIKSLSPLLYAGLQDFIKRDGKRIRPILFILGYKGYTSKRISHDKVIQSSLSLEVLHDFLLIHDDIIDKSALRRGKPAMHRLFNAKLSIAPSADLGSDLAIVAGDILFSMAVDALLTMNEDPDRKEKALKKFLETVSLTGIGEFIDVLNNVKPLEKISRKEIMDTYILKTARYTFASPLVIGAILAGAGNKELKKLSNIGTSLGQAFQILDDMLDIFSTSKKTGKPVLSDLDEGKKTLLIFETFNCLSKKDKLVLSRSFKKTTKTKKDLLKIKELIESTTAKDRCLDIVSALLEDAEEIYSTLKIKKLYSLALYDIIRRLDMNLNGFLT